MSDENDENDDNENLPEIRIKILIIGDSDVGKTAILLKYVDNKFPEQHICTIGVEYKDKIIYRTDYKIKLQIWDTAGQERFHSITKNIYRGTNGVFFVYEIINRETFNNIKKWIKDTQEIDKKIIGVIIGNKIDLNDNRKIEKDELEELSKKYNMSCIETSAKNGTNIKEAFDLLINELLKNKSLEEIIKIFGRHDSEDVSQITEKTEIQKKKKKCC